MCIVFPVPNAHERSLALLFDMREKRVTRNIYEVGGVALSNAPIMIGAGVCKTPAATADWLAVAPVVSGSYTVQQRSGNSGRVLYPETLEEFFQAGFGLNSYGMPNQGLLSDVSKDLAALPKTNRLIVSIAGFEPWHYYAGALAVHDNATTAAIELNFGCPNTQGDHPDILSFNPSKVEEILTGMVDNNYSKPIWLKFSPYSNPQELLRMAAVVNQFHNRLQLAVVTCNTFPNAYAGPQAIDGNKGLAGLSGSALKPIALGQVRQWATALNADIDLIGVGGITTGNDVVDFLEAEADAVQLTSLPHWSGDPARFWEYLLDETTGARLSRVLEDDDPTEGEDQ